MLPSVILPASPMARQRPGEGRCNVKTLMDSTTGAYLVTTVASTYLIDLDRLVIKEPPAPTMLAVRCCAATTNWSCSSSCASAPSGNTWR